MPIDIENITDTLTGVTDTLSVPAPTSSLSEVSQRKMNQRAIMRAVLVLVILAIIASLTYYLK